PGAAVGLRPLGRAVAPVLIGVCAQAFGWRGAFLLIGLVGIAWVAGFYAWFRDTPAEHPGVNAAERALIEQGTAAGAKPAPLSWTTMLRQPMRSRRERSQF